MRIPFGRELDDVFQGDRSIWLKMGGCAVATAFIVVAATVRFVQRGDLKLALTPPVLTVLIGISAAIGALLALGLALKDVVERRVDRGQPVNPILRLYFGMGVKSLIAWFPTVIIIAFGVIMATLP